MRVNANDPDAGPRTTDTFECEAGVAQGAVDSPTLYDVFIDQIAHDLIREGFGVSYGASNGEVVPLLMYADDIVLLATTPEQLQRMLCVVERHSKQWQFTYNAAKCEVVVAARRQLMAKRRAADGEHKWSLNGHTLVVADAYTYLGIEFGVLGAGRWRDTVQRMRRTCAFVGVSCSGALAIDTVSPLLSSYLCGGPCADHFSNTAVRFGHQTCPETNVIVSRHCNSSLLEQRLVCPCPRVECSFVGNWG